MPALKAPLPPRLSWLTTKVEELVRPAAFLVCDDAETGPAPMGATRRRWFDVPRSATWAKLGRRQDPRDGECAWLQLNLEDIPDEVRRQRPELPAAGMVWVTLNLATGEYHQPWSAQVYVDERPAQTIDWPVRAGAGQVASGAPRFMLADTLTRATDKTLPEISSDRHEGGLYDEYDAWRSQHYGGRPSEVQLGGRMHPARGDTDTLRKTLVLAMEHQEFGADDGAVYLHYSPERGFFAQVRTYY